MSLFSDHINRLKASAGWANDQTQVANWLTANTTIEGRPFSFRDHEWQIGPLGSSAREIVMIKPSQVGATEMSARWVLARLMLLRSYTAIYAMPSAHFARTFAKTRLDAIINDSESLKNAVSPVVNSSDVKQFGSSYLYLKGASVGAQAISVPCSAVIVDEMDFCDQTVLSLFTSRLTHSTYRHQIKLSTPTIPDFGIHAAFEGTTKHFRMCKCGHCGEWSHPDFFRDIRVPNVPNFPVEAITNEVLAKFPSYRDAWMACPKCGKPMDFSAQYREWVAENDGIQRDRHGFQVSPFDTPKYNTPDYIIESATKYARKIDWQNFTLGLPADDRDSTLSREEMKACLIDADVMSGSYSYVMGLDIGVTSYCVIAAVTPLQQLIIVHIEAIPLEKLLVRRAELVKQYRIRTSVADAMPWSETVHRMQLTDKNLYAAIYSNLKSLETHQIKLQDEDAKAGKLNLRTVFINRDRAFDVLMDEARTGGILKVRSELDETWISHACDMKRVRLYKADSQELMTTWRKSERGQDHAWHATLYAWTASRLLGTSAGFSGALPLFSTFKLWEGEGAA